MPSSQADLSTLFDHRLLIFTGKGGVGKSLMSAGAALRSARSGKRTLWVEMSEAPKGSYLFSGYTPKYDPAEIEPNLSAMNLLLKPAIEEYLEIVFKVPLLTRRIARNSLFQVLTAALPGLEALVTLGKIWYEFERLYRGAPYWDRIVVDAPATGHALSLLRFPQAALDIVGSGPIAERSRDIDRMLRDPARTAIVIVTLLEDLPVEESRELIASIRQDTPYPLAGLIENAVLPDIGQDDPRFAAWLAGQPDESIDAVLGDRADAVRGRLRWLEAWRSQQLALEPRLADIDIPRFRVPWLPAGSEPELLELLLREVLR
ncbi:MAG: hypothetical protein D6761_05640 [Candidatus Dadabacteria bacterium]|nr:MAG: hypothetical protein D6761_05640 [Candidatus Dadabacteria bacterium]